MRKLLVLALVLMVSVVLGGIAYGQAAAEKAKPAAEKPAAAPERAVKAEKPGGAPEKADKPKAKTKPKVPGMFTGAVTKVNTEVKTLSVKGTRGAVTFDVSRPIFKGYKVLGDVKIKDRVGVQYVKEGTRVHKLGGKAVGVEKAPKAKPAKAKADTPKASKGKARKAKAQKE